MRTDIVPATVDLSGVKEEARLGDRLLPAPPRSFDNYAPHCARGAGGGQRGVHLRRRRGGQCRAEPGHRHQPRHRRRHAGRPCCNCAPAACASRTRPTSSAPRSACPAEDNGLAMVFLTFERVSHALILQAQRGVVVGDRLVNPVGGRGAEFQAMQRDELAPPGCASPSRPAWATARRGACWPPSACRRTFCPERSRLAVLRDGRPGTRPDLPSPRSWRPCCRPPGNGCGPRGRAGARHRHPGRCRLSPALLATEDPPLLLYLLGAPRFVHGAGPFCAAALPGHGGQPATPRPRAPSMRASLRVLLRRG